MPCALCGGPFLGACKVLAERIVCWPCYMRYKRAGWLRRKLILLYIRRGRKVADPDA